MRSGATAASRAAGTAAIGSAALGLLGLVTWGALNAWVVALSQLLLVPAAVVWMLRLETEAGTMIVLATGAGVVSQVLWAGTVLTGHFVPRLETVGLALAGLWWVGLGAGLLRSRSTLGWVTLCLAGLAGLDAALVMVETRTSAVPIWLAPAGPLRPLAAMAWSVAIGLSLIRDPWTPPPPDAAEARIAARWERFSGRKR